MSAGRIDLVIDRLLVDGLDLAPGEAEELARRVEEELRGLADPRAQAQGRHTTLLEAKPLSLGQAADTRTLARALAERIAAEAGIGAGGVGAHGRP